MKRGFSLVEVLIAVLVLALGLLGLGAVFPVILAEQRDAFDSTNGEIAAEYVAGLIEADSELVPVLIYGDEPGAWAKRDAQQRLTFGTASSNSGPGVRPQPAGSSSPPVSELWIVTGLADLSGLDPGFAGGDGAVPGFNFETGAWFLDTESASSQFVPTGSRLYPPAHSGVDPKFVWDVVARRSTGSSIEVCVFIRRIDNRTRVPRGFTLAQVLTGGAALMPFALDGATGRLVADDPNVSGLFYPVPISIAGTVGGERGWFVIDANTASDENLDTSISFFRQVGQRFVDNTGVVRTVVGLPNGRWPGDEDIVDRSVIVDPPFSLANATNGSPSRVVQAVFTPQVPAAVRVFSLDQGGSRP